MASTLLFELPRCLTSPVGFSEVRVANIHARLIQFEEIALSDIAILVSCEKTISLLSRVYKQIKIFC